MNMAEKTARALEAHPLITAAGICSTPKVFCDGGGDTDIFVYCSKIPGERERLELISGASQDFTPGTEPGRWGLCDLTHIDGNEVWLMYVTEEDTQREIEAILKGDWPDRLDNYYYPVGRLATIKNLKALFDKTGFIGQLKSKVETYPDELARKLTRFHAEALSDTEDLERAAKRGDVLYYHFALDLALDHFLQALFALNREYFPSRKRSLKYIAGFKLKPPRCEETLLEAVRLGSSAEGTSASFELVAQLIEWTRSQRL